MKRLLSILGIVVTVTLGLCPPVFADEKIKIVVTIPPLADFVEHIGKDKVGVTVMIPTRAEPHTYEPTPQQIKEVSQAKLYVKVGTAIEFELFWLNKILSSNIPLCDSSAGIYFLTLDEDVNSKEHVLDCMKAAREEALAKELLKPLSQRSVAARSPNLRRDISHGDPHIWLSVSNAIQMVNNIKKALMSIDAGNAIFYSQNAEKYLSELQVLREELKKDLEFYIGKSFLTVHPEWGYFAREYQLEQISIEAQGKEPTADGLAKLIADADAKNVKMVLAAPQFSRKSADIIAREIGAKVIMADALSRNYIENLRSLKKKMIEVWEQ